MIGSNMTEAHPVASTFLKNAVRNNPEYLSLADLADYASVSANTLKKWQNCSMPYYRVGRCLRVKRGEFGAWMRQFRSGTFKPELDPVWDQVMEKVTC